MAEFTLRPKIDTDHSDAYAPNAVRSDPTKDWWEHIFGLDDDLYIWTPVINKLYSAATCALINENDLPSVSSADGKMTSLTVFARGKVTDTGGSGIFEIYSVLWPYMSSRLEFNEADGWINHSGIFNIGAHNSLNELHDIEIGGGVQSKLTLYDAKKYLDYVYCEVDYTPAPPSITWQWIYKLDEGNLAALWADHMYSTFLKEWGFEIRLKSTQEIVKIITWTGRKLQGKSWNTELIWPDLLYGTTYEGRGYGITDDGKGVGAWVEFTTRTAPATIINIKATKSAGHLKLYGEITDITGPTIVERGFEYLIQNSEPGVEDIGTEVKEIGGPFIEEEYNLSSWGTFNDLYRAKENEVWWFRAYCLDDAETPNKYVAPTWMKNVPTLTTSECTEIHAQEATANGELIDKGANDVTWRGFRIIKEYKGDQFNMEYYIGIATGAYKVLGDIKEHVIRDELGRLIGYYWTGIFYRDSIVEGNYDLGIYDKVIGGGFLGERFGTYLRPNDTYLVQAIAKNELGWGFGEYVNANTLLALLHKGDLEGYTEGDHKNVGIGFAGIVESVEMQGEEPEIVEYEDMIQFTTGRYILPGEDENVSETSAEKTIKLGVIPEEATVTRIGIRLGRTKGCNEIHVYQDGEWGSYAEVTFFIEGFEPGCTYYKMPYIIIDYGDYSEEILAMPDYTNPDKLEEYLDDYPIEIFPEVEEEPEKEIVDSSVGDISYRTIIREIKCEVVGEQSLIDYYGRRRSKTINNHMIQSKSVCIIIINNYLDKFQRIKLKVVIEIDMPIPFEREDVILLGDGKIKYKEDAQGLIAFKADGEGELLQKGYILAKVRKIDISYIASTETEAILLLELEV